VINYTLRAYSKPFIRFKMQLIGKQATIPNHSTILTSMRKQRGFTLIELMVILAIVAIIAGFGVPQIIGLIQNNRVVSQVNNLSAQLQYARSEAVRRASAINVIANDTGTTNWKGGWTVYIDSDNDNTVDKGEELRIVAALDIPNVTITGPSTNIVFSADGSSGTAQILTLADTKTSTSYTVNISTTGNIKIKKI